MNKNQKERPATVAGRDQLLAAGSNMPSRFHLLAVHYGVEKGMSRDMNVATNTEGALLLSLDSELEQREKETRWAILLHSLFSRRVCMTDTQIIDNPVLEKLFRRHWDELESESESAAEVGRPPMIGLLSRRGADIGGVLDLMLTPNARTGLPSYFSRFTEEENRHLRDRLGRASNTDEKREVLFSVDRRFKGHISRATKYFQQNPLAP
jgi:hypothetical protein